MTGSGTGLQGGNKRWPPQLNGIMSQLKSWVNSSLLLIDSASPVGVTSAINADCCMAAGIRMPAKVHKKHPNQTEICQVLKISGNTLLCICNSIQSHVWESWPRPHPSLCLQIQPEGLSLTAIPINHLKQCLAIWLLWFNTVITIIQTMLKPLTVLPKLFISIGFYFTTIFNTLNSEVPPLAPLRRPRLYERGSLIFCLTKYLITAFNFTVYLFNLSPG